LGVGKGWYWNPRAKLTGTQEGRGKHRQDEVNHISRQGMVREIQHRQQMSIPDFGISQGFKSHTILLLPQK